MRELIWKYQNKFGSVIAILECTISQHRERQKRMDQEREKDNRIRHHIFIVEDDNALAAGLCRALQNEDTETTSCGSLREADVVLSKRQGTEEKFSLIVLDINLPDGNGIDFLQRVKKKYDINVIILTANDMETDIVTGLELGADDYITKPFSLAVLRARVALQLRRAKERGMHSPSTEICVGEYRFDFAHMKFYHGTEQVELSKTEQKLLHILVENRGLTIPRERLFEYIWSEGEEFVEENALSVTVKRLRDKLKAHEIIKTVYGIGYTWVMQ